MSQTTHNVVRSKQDRMTAVQTAINKTKMTTALVWNPWPGVMEQGVTTEAIKSPAKSGQVPEIIGEGQTLGDFMSPVLISFGSTLGLGGPVTQNTFDEARKRAKARYVTMGRTFYKEFASGNCTLFACAIIGMLSEQPKLLGPGVKVELLNLLNTEGGGGHAYVVVGRAAGDVNDVDTYGPDCFFVDQWYARQQGTQPGVQGVKDATPGNGVNPFWDATFDRFIREATTRVMLTFTSDELPQLRF
ncbi:hypothetical protein [Sphaerisporangium album]|nr:hypothetical protein [Sphaerisporangium album]